MKKHKNKETKNNILFDEKKIYEMLFYFEKIFYLLWIFLSTSNFPPFFINFIITFFLLNITGLRLIQLRQNLKLEIT